MRYVVECRSKDESGNIAGIQFRGFGPGLPDKKAAVQIYNREVNSGKWDAVYMEKLYKGGELIEDRCWYKCP